MRVRRYTYPHYWKKIARALRAIRGMKCEQCGAPHGKLITRRIDNPYFWMKWRDGMMGKADEYIWQPPKINIVSIHHIGVDKPDGTPGSSLDKMDCRPKNLIALCARCHLIADKVVSAKHAAETKREIKHQRILATGQLEIFK